MTRLAHPNLLCLLVAFALVLAVLCGCNTSRSASGTDIDVIRSDVSAEDITLSDDTQADVPAPEDVEVADPTPDVGPEDIEDVAVPDVADADVEPDVPANVDVAPTWPPEWQDCACYDERDVCTPRGALYTPRCLRDIGRPCVDASECPEGYECAAFGDLPSLCLQRGALGLLQFCPTEHVPDARCGDEQVCDGQGDVCRYPRADCFTTMDCARDEFCARREISANRRELETWFTPEELIRYDEALAAALADPARDAYSGRDSTCLPIADFPSYAAWATPPVENPITGAVGPLCRTSADCSLEQFCANANDERLDAKRHWGSCLNGTSTCPRETFEIRTSYPPDDDGYDCLYPTIRCERHEQCPTGMACVDRSFSNATNPDLCGIRRFEDGSLGVAYYYQNQRLSRPSEEYPTGRRYLPDWMQGDE